MMASTLRSTLACRWAVFVRTGAALVIVAASPVGAAEIGPPMFDIAKQCDGGTHGNATAMSECVVAESEARAELLQNWSKYSDANAAQCIKLGRKARRNPYAVMVKCVADEAGAARASAPAKTTSGAAPSRK